MAPYIVPNCNISLKCRSAGCINPNPRDDMKAHSIYVEQRTIYKCSCDREFDDIQKAESHLRNPPQEKGKSLRPKKHAARRREPKTVMVTAAEIPEASGKRAWLSPSAEGDESQDGS